MWHFVTKISLPVECWYSLYVHQVLQKENGSHSMSYVSNELSSKIFALLINSLDLVSYSMHNLDLIASKYLFPPPSNPEVAAGLD